MIRLSRSAVVGATCAIAMVLSRHAAHAQAAPADALLIPEPTGSEDGDHEPQIDVDLDGTVKVDWSLHPSFTLRLFDDDERDRSLQEWPINLMEGTHITAGMGVLEYGVGPVSFQLGGGVGIATSDTVSATGQLKRAQSLAAIGTVEVELKLPRRWYVRAGVNAAKAAGETKLSVGVTAGTQF